MDAEAQAGAGGTHSCIIALMDPASDLDELVAAHIMGWNPCPPDFRPSSRWSDTRSVIDHIHRRVHDEATFEALFEREMPNFLTIQYTGNQWGASFGAGLPESWWDTPDDCPYTAVDDSLERAICIAALSTYGVDLK